MSTDDELEALFNRKRIEKKESKNGKKPVAKPARRVEPVKAADRQDERGAGGPSVRPAVDRKPPAPVAPAPATGRRPARNGNKGSNRADAPVGTGTATADQKVGEKSTSVRHVACSIPQSHYPKKYQPTDLSSGQSVWYRGERYWVLTVPKDWADSCHVRIADSRIRPESGIPNGTLCFCVHADMLDLATTTRNPFSRQPSLSEEQRRTRAKETGINDNGDPVAEALRKCGTIDAAYSTAAGFLKLDEQELRAKYAKLNPGQQRMNLGNRMRNYLKKNPDAFKELQ